MVAPDDPATTASESLRMKSRLASGTPHGDDHGSPRAGAARRRPTRREHLVAKPGGREVVDESKEEPLS